MQGYERTRGVNIEKLMAKLYLYFLPFQMFTPFIFLNSLFVGLGKRASFLFLLMVIFVSFLSIRGLTYRNDKSGKLFNHFIFMYIVGDITSLVMAAVLFSELGTIGGENTFNGVIPKICFTFAYMVFMYYNQELFRQLSKEEIGTIFDRIVTICICIGFLQIFVILFGGPFSQIYDIINLAFEAWSLDRITFTGRIALLTTEPASGAGFLGVVVAPYLFSKYIANKFKFIDSIKLLLIIIVLYFTKSTTGYSLLSLDFLLFGFIILRTREINTAKKTLVIFLMIIAFAIFGITVVANEVLFGHITSVFDKLFNLDNTSSMSRKVGLYVNWGIFQRFPLFGVGNGNQGFFYREFFPKEAFSSIWAVERYNEAAYTLMDGGVFFGAFLSGYGIIGFGLLIAFIRKSIIIMKNNKRIYGYLYYFYIISGVALVVNGLSSTLVGDYSMWFIVSLPLAIRYWKSDGLVPKTN